MKTLKRWKKIKGENMEEVIKFLTETPQQYLATIGLDGKAKVRPILFYFAEDNKPYFCTNNQKSMYKELKENPEFEMTGATPEFAWIRIAGKVEFVDDLEIKQKVVDSNDLVKALYESGDNPIFEVFTIAEGSATIADFSGNPAQTYEI